MPKKRGRPRREQDSNVPSWSMYPNLDHEVAQLLEEDDLDFSFNNEDNPDCDQDYKTSIMGKFKCCNTDCRSDGWSSKKIAITIRMYSGRRYNARVYYQRCQTCDWRSEPILDDSYAERVAYRLKKWSGREVEAPEYGPKRGEPHKEDLCEACKIGECAWGSIGD